MYTTLKESLGYNPEIVEYGCLDRKQHYHEQGDFYPQLFEKKETINIYDDQDKFAAFSFANEHNINLIAFNAKENSKNLNLIFGYLKALYPSKEIVQKNFKKKWRMGIL